MTRLLFNKKGQNTAEYAILIALVVAAIVAMQTYAQRSMQARVRDTNIYLKDRVGQTTFKGSRDGTGTSETRANLGLLGQTAQYEPYYQKSTYDNERASERVTQLDGDAIGYAEQNIRKRTSGSQESVYTQDANETTGLAVSGVDAIQAGN